MTGPKFFSASELFHPSYITEHGEAGVWKLLPQRIWELVDEFRVAWGKPLHVNYQGLVNCGVRPLDYGGPTNRSHHKPIYPDNIALDYHGRTAEETKALYDWVLSEGWKLANVGRVENWAATCGKPGGTGWVHCEHYLTAPTACKVFMP